MKKYGLMECREAEESGLPDDGTTHLDITSRSAGSIAVTWNQQWNSGDVASIVGGIAALQRDATGAGNLLVLEDSAALASPVPAEDPGTCAVIAGSKRAALLAEAADCDLGL